MAKSDFISNKQLKKFMKDLEKVEKDTLKRTKRVIYEASEKLLEDSRKDIPRDTYAMMNSGLALDEDGKLIAQVQRKKTKRKWRKKQLKLKKSEKEILTTVSYNTNYVIPMHEGEWKDGTKVKGYSHPSAKRYFLKRNMQDLDKYLKKNIKFVKGKKEAKK
ncbi:hypothetical protein ACKXGF_07505 [Alkalibacillus sp. S2W]|uniref:hypothetical protein n=1 Tax=Alkalibacillus sp. S2W TaxID=3386553 RepID=UPI00398CAF06